MKKHLIIIMPLIVILAFGGYYFFIGENEKSAEIDQTLNVLGNFAENHEKTADNMKTFRDLLSQPAEAPEEAPAKTE